MAHILIIEDNPEINRMESQLLGDNGFTVTSAYSGTEGLLLLERGGFDLVLLDLMLPGKNGGEVLEEIRKSSDICVLCVSAVDEMDTKLGMLRSGADDYITKPFDNNELIVRIEALLRRSGKQSGGRKLTYKDLVLDTDTRLVTVSGVPAELTRKEYEILELFMSNPRKVFTRDNIFEAVWHEELMPEDNAVSVHVSNLRSKLAQANPDGVYIKTVWGIGFKLAE